MVATAHSLQTLGLPSLTFWDAILRRDGVLSLLEDNTATTKNRNPKRQPSQTESAPRRDRGNHSGLAVATQSGTLTLP